MPRTRTPRLITISGPIASGKSTIAAAMSAEARRRGFTVALTDLDTVAEMALPTLPDWVWALRVHAQLVGAWLATDIDLVIDEGTSNRYEVGLVLRQVPATTEVGHIVLIADLMRSLHRAQSDPGRGASKEAEFLAADHAHYAEEIPHLRCDLQRLKDAHPNIWRPKPSTTSGSDPLIADRGPRRERAGQHTVITAVWARPVPTNPFAARSG